MPVDPRTVARKLKQARELQSLSVSTVSEAMGLGSNHRGVTCFEKSNTRRQRSR